MKQLLIVIGCTLGFVWCAGSQEIQTLPDTMQLVFDGPVGDVTVTCNAIPVPPNVKAVGGCDAQVFAKDLVLYYPFDEDLGTVVQDASGHGRTAAVDGASWVADGARGGAYRFDGNSQSITATDAGLPSGNAPRTMAVWIKVDKLCPDGTTGMFSYGTWQWNQACGLGLDWRLDRDQYYFTQNGGVALSQAKVEPGVWHHLAYVYNGDGRHQLYVDGEPSSGMSELRGPLNTTPSGLLMLAGHPGSIGPEGGYLDEAMIFDRALSPAEVAAVYHGALPVETLESADGECPRVITRVWAMRGMTGDQAYARTIPVELKETSAGDCPRVITRRWSATDRCGNTAGATQTITVVDTTPPELVGVPANAALKCGSDIPRPPTVTARDTDACGGGDPGGMVLRFEFESRQQGKEARGGVVFDSSGNGNHGVVSGARIGRDGVEGKAAHFDGVDDFIRVPSSPTLIPEAVTVSAWVKVHSRPQDIAVIAHKRNTSLHNNEDYVLQLTAAGAARLVLANSGHQTRLDSAPLSPGKWHHVAATFARPVMAIYVDGRLAGTAQHDYPLAHNPKADLFLAASDHLEYPMASFAHISLDDVRVYPRALTSPEVGAMLRGTLPVDFMETSSGDCPGQITRVWSAADRCGNTASATQTITLLPPTAPILVGVPEDVEIACGAAVPPPPVVTALAAPGCEAAPLPGLILHYPFDEDLGGTVLDASGGGRTGQVNGATWVPDGAHGGAFRFDSNQQCITATDAGLPAGDAPRTIAAWVRLDTAMPDVSTGLIFYGKRYFYNQESGVGVDGRQDRDRFFFSQGGACFLSQRKVGDVGQWVHVAYTYGGEGRHHLYVNGEASDGANELVGGLNTVLDGILRVGGQPWDTGLAGISVDEVMIFDRELSPAEVAALQQNGADVQMTETAEGGCPGTITRVWTATDRCGNTASATQRMEVAGAPGAMIRHVWQESPAPEYPFDSWEKAAHTIQEAVDAAVPGDIVLVTNGVYESGARVTPGYRLLNRVVITNDITVRSVNGPEVTVIRGQGPRGSNAVRGVHMIAGRLIGFTVTNGHTRLDGDGTYDQNQGGINMCPSTVAIVSNCLITGCSAYSSGGTAWGRVYNSIIRGNRAVFSSGGAGGSGILYNCLLEDNTVEQFGGGADQSKLYNCTIMGNTAASGGGVYNCQLFNCVVSANQPDNVRASTCRYTCTMPLQPGAGNRADDPLLLPDGHLAPDSPCIGQGSSDYALGMDLDGDAWRDPPAMGCDEPAVSSVVPATRHVWPDSPAPAHPFDAWENAAHTIQEAVDVAVPGDTVLVTNGIYETGTRVTPGHLLLNRVVITNDITVRSVNGPQVTIIRGQGPRGASAVRGVYLTAGRLIGFTIENGHTRTDGDGSYDQNGGGVNAYLETRPVISNCVIRGNRAHDSAGSAWGTLYNCCIYSNIAERASGGCAAAKLYNCWLADNSAGDYGGGADQATLVNCTVRGNSALNGGGVFHCMLLNSIVYDNTPANVDWVECRYTCTTPLQPGAGNLAEDPQLLAGCHIAANSPCVGRGASAYATGFDIDGDPWRVPPSLGCDEPVVPPLNPTIRHVWPDSPAPGPPFDGWENAAHTIQEAVDAAVPGDTVLVTNGVYETGTRVTPGYQLLNRVVITNDITVRSVNGPEATVVRGQGPRGTNAVRGVYIIAGRLIGFTIANGHTRMDGEGSYNQAGGGLNAHPSVGVVVSNCIFTGNSAYASGGATSCTFYNCLFSGNTAERSGGGVASATLYNCAVLDNSASTFGGGADQCDAYNCTIAGNTAANGGGVYNCRLYNCIVYSNTPANVAVATCRYTCTTPAQSGTGNIADNPRLLAGGHIALDSPCAGKGSATYAFGTDIDGDAWLEPPSMGCDEPVGVPTTTGDWYVAMDGNDSADGTSWATAKQTIQAAVDLARAGDTVWVSNGVYETGTRVTPGHLVMNRVVITSDITVRSVNGPEATVIRGQGPRGTNAVRCVYMAAGELMGFTLTDGHTRYDGDGNLDQNGGGVSVFPGAVVMVSNCNFIGNAAYNGGGSCYGSYYNCIFRSNQADRAAGATTQGVRYNCEMSFNHAVSWGGAADQCELVNCTLTGNMAEWGGGAFHCTMANSIVHGNTGTYGPNVDWVECRYTCTTPLQPGEGNLAEDPKLLAGGHIAADSPCVGKGSAGYAFGTDIDGDAWLEPPSMGCDEPYPPVPLRMAAKSGVSGTGRLTISSSTDRVYTLQRCADLVAGIWLDVPGQVRIQGTGGELTLADPESLTACYYRVVSSAP